MANPNIGRRVIVDVTAHASGPPGIYTIDWRFDGDPTGKGNTRINLPRNSGSHDMTFNLIDPTNIGLHFMPRADDAIWVRPGMGQCPVAAGTGGGQMSGGVVKPGGMSLDINDDNSGNTHYLTYRLNFDRAGYYFDPDIRNGGTGTGSGTTAALTTIGIIAGVVGTNLVTETATTMSFFIGAAIGAGIGYVANLALAEMRARSPQAAMSK